ncbi:MAG: hypothetical protein UU72_C0003G0046 [candidate division WWE3 bacterium GW2011_GWB1_41_6]|uniref:Uncharacterized protein n=1 Tax=candidate division WWE3 bacterium GW2011_GWB1_41_6 TaxID=1619112 RepID=A0A0G0WXC0_UNCKA|nr:MAG: hypothetical protein UU72_C0003G0046 [candidate division WWE3 bacterium GW2011_GWB1_41_6]
MTTKFVWFISKGKMSPSFEVITHFWIGEAYLSVISPLTSCQCAIVEALISISPPLLTHTLQLISGPTALQYKMQALSLLYVLLICVKLFVTKSLRNYIPKNDFNQPIE